MRIRAHPDIEQAAMTGVNTEPITAASVVHDIKYVWYAVVVVAGGNSLGALLIKSATKC